MSTPFKLRCAAAYVRQGGVIAYPTEAVYGLGCDPLQADAVLRLIDLKQRPWQKGVILLASCWSQVAPYVVVDGQMQAKLMDSWPGPYTWLVPAQPWVPWWIRGRHSQVAVRITDHPLAAALCDHVGHAVVSTSANPAGRPAAKARTDLDPGFAAGIDMWLSGELGGLSQPTQIRDVCTDMIIRS